MGLVPYLKYYTNHSFARLDNNVAERAVRPLGTVNSPLMLTKGIRLHRSCNEFLVSDLFNEILVLLLGDMGFSDF
jgi:hypothetical protein